MRYLRRIGLAIVLIAVTSQQPATKTIASAAKASAQALRTANIPFAKLSDELIVRGIGHAEGTRTAWGGKTRAYYGHSDPGNGVWNLGSFSWQHGAKSPEEADMKQLARLKRQSATILAKAKQLGLKLSLEETLNAMDLANQAPLAALDDGGFVDRLLQAKKQKLKGEAAILWARTQSYRNPRTGRWEAPGLGNTEDGISHDQNRRMTAIQRAIAVYRQQKGEKPVSFNQGEVTMLVIQSLVEQGVR